MALYKYIRKSWNSPTDEVKALWRERLIQWRQEPATVRIERSTRIDRARSLGYKAKQGFILIRQRVTRGGRQNPQARHPRRSKRMSRRKDLALSYQVVAEGRAVQKYPNCEVLNSYYVAEDGLGFWYEVILVDRNSPSILADPEMKWVAGHRGRLQRGLTSAARKSRGLRHKGKGFEKMRPSLRSHSRNAH